MAIGIVGFCACVAVVGWYFGYVMGMNGYHSGYNSGWRDCEKAHKYFEQTEDEERVLRELKKATKQHIRDTGMYERGDIKLIDQVNDMSELKHAVHNICVHRREQA